MPDAPLAEKISHSVPVLFVKFAVAEVEPEPIEAVPDWTEEVESVNSITCQATSIASPLSWRVS